MMHPSIKQARQLANLMDKAITIPIIQQKIGLDPILGVIPVAGDTVALIISLYPVWVAFELGLPKKLLVTMILNILIDYVMGLIPVMGEIADALWRANSRNVDLLELAYAEMMENQAKVNWTDNRVPGYNPAQVVLDITPNSV